METTFNVLAKTAKIVFGAGIAVLVGCVLVAILAVCFGIAG